MIQNDEICVLRSILMKRIFLLHIAIKELCRKSFDIIEQVLYAEVFLLSLFKETHILINFVNSNSRILNCIIKSSGISSDPSIDSFNVNLIM